MSDVTTQKRELMSDEIALLQKNPLLPQGGVVIDCRTHGDLGLREAAAADVVSGILGLQKAAAADVTSGTTYLRFDFALVVVKTIAWSGSGSEPSAET